MPDPTDPDDAPLPYVALPTEATIPATFTHIGDIQPAPVPDLDD